MLHAGSKMERSQELILWALGVEGTNCGGQEMM